MKREEHIWPNDAQILHWPYEYPYCENIAGKKIPLFRLEQRAFLHLGFIRCHFRRQANRLVGIGGARKFWRDC